MRGIDVEALLGVGYAIFLALVAAALELLARHSHQRTQRDPHRWILLPRGLGCLEMPQRQTPLSG